jgi:hypothetical protein
MTLKLYYAYPPIPDRNHDWMAYDDNTYEPEWLMATGRMPRRRLPTLCVTWTRSARNFGMRTTSGR